MADTMPEGQTAPENRTLIERLARYLATLNADVARPSDAWADHIERAASLLAILKDPDAAMAEAGDAAVWRRMIDAALVARWTLDASLAASKGAAPGGSDEEGDIRIEQNAPGVETASSWVRRGSSAP